MHRAGLRRAPLVAALAWSLALIVGALIFPVYSGAGSASQRTLVAVNGPWVLELVCVPAVVTAFVSVALHRRCARGSRAAEIAAGFAVAVLAAFNLVAIFTIGIFIVPVTALLVWALRSSGVGGTVSAASAVPGGS
jgi:hypothetical protein